MTSSFFSFRPVTNVNIFSSANRAQLVFREKFGKLGLARVELSGPIRFDFYLSIRDMLSRKKASGSTRLKRVHPIEFRSSLTSRFHDSRFSMAKHVENEVWKLKLATSSGR